MPDDAYFSGYFPEGAFPEDYFPQTEAVAQTGGLVFGGSASVVFTPAPSTQQTFGGGGYMNSPARKKAVRRKREEEELVLGLY